VPLSNVPTAQALDGESAAILKSSACEAPAGLGLATSPQWRPFQCSISVWVVPLKNSPTVQALVRDGVATPKSSACGEPAGLGLATSRQWWPFQCSISVWVRAVEEFPHCPRLGARGGRNRLEQARGWRLVTGGKACGPRSPARVAATGGHGRGGRRDRADCRNSKRDLEGDSDLCQSAHGLSKQSGGDWPNIIVGARPTVSTIGFGRGSNSPCWLQQVSWPLPGSRRGRVS
jgi:hypothetical protein